MAKKTRRDADLDPPGRRWSDDLARDREAFLGRERLRVLGELAAGIAHDLGNTLRGAAYHLVAARASRTGQERNAALDGAATRVEVAASLVARLHGFARRGSLELAPVRLDNVVAQAVALTETELADTVHPVRVKIAVPRARPVLGSVAELSLLFVNMIRNARDAMPDGGTITISATPRARKLVVTVADEGTGLDPAQEERLFRPFFTTKGDKGTGLGLWLAATALERVGGAIRAANHASGGAVFTLEFPYAGPKPLPAPRPKAGARRRAARSPKRSA